MESIVLLLLNFFFVDIQYVPVQCTLCIVDVHSVLLNYKQTNKLKKGKTKQKITGFE